MPPIENSVGEFVEKTINDNNIVIFSKTTCPFCVKAKELITSMTSQPIAYIQLDAIENGKDIQDYLASKTGQRTVPNIFLKGQHIGGFDSLSKLNSESRLAPLLSTAELSVSSEIRPKATETIEQFCINLIKDNKIMIFSKENCPFAAKVKELFTSINEKFASIELDKLGKLIDRRHHELQLA
jgi:glutaredoxin